MPTILLIRPANRLPEDVATCRQFGWQYIPFPPLNIVPHHERIDHLPERIEESDAVFWVSPTAVEVAGLNLSGSLKPHIAVGYSTSKALREFGAAWVWYPSTGNDSEAVLELPIWEKLPIGGEILIVNGTGGRNYLAQQLVQRGYHVSNMKIYHREEQVLDWLAFKEHRPYFAWVTSAQMVNIVFKQAPISLTQTLKSLIYFTHHQRIADALRQHGVGQIRIVKNLTEALQKYSAQSID
ncbi:uroporphyrinogen-III synthase [Simonsiella muelleri]|jgi:hypothetical protein|uniref:Tetrapyrrole biosynthesis uroporphyrinogen III synthase domain-containing protein n=1 Tax=Simonsiella muelleri ATCC 29453 TaxID=641147 RepID=V9HDV9_9NEIS|nr:uroporphyrinogen-III synthase [Simonsiella muelleri]AUX62514.1 hypothetical protein BWP33_01550 [Simonsiella muelleri ATCC 29453]EFG31804.2 hypothetical protein HMPREF9021_00203 [Simonsiella muelleri ATCC 29453]UBQ54534.1 uroporphyrinogen-III synthase [Simonsiella muelleri]